jgi:hypothetical protein
LYQFTGYGVPLVYYNGHDDYLSRQPFFFARKFSPHARGLRDSMDLRSVNGEVSPLPDDDKVGKLSTDYARFLMTHGRGLFGRRVIGRVRNAWYGDLEWNARPYFVIVGECSRTLRMAQEILNERPDMLCHGELFDATTIRFADNADRFAGYGSGDLKLRDQKPQNFLVDILNESPDKLTGYLWLHGPYLESGHPKRLNPRRNMAELHSWDHNANLLVIRRNPEVLFEEALDNKNASNNDDRFLAEGFARFYSGYLDDYFKISEAANCSGAKIRFLYVAHDDEAVLRETLGQDSDAQGGVTIWPADGGAINARGWNAASEVIRNPELKNIARAVERGYHKRTHGKE